MSTWKLPKSKNYPKLDQNIEIDVAIVGGGLAGAWCAYLLSASGKKVAVFEKDKVGGGETEYTTAFITQAIDTPLVELVEIFDLDRAEAVWRSGEKAIQLIENVVKAEQIDCEFERMPVHIYARSAEEFGKLAHEHVLAEKLGFKTSLHRSIQLGFVHEGVLELPGQAKYHPLKFLAGLFSAAERLGVQIFENTKIEEVVGNAPVKLVAEGGQVVTAKEVVIATYDPLGNPRTTRFKKGMYTSYVLELKIPAGRVPEGMYIDQHNPYHYTRVDALDSESARMIVGGEDHRSEIKVPEEKNYKALKEYVSKTFNIKARALRKWKGAILEPSDGLALIGETTPRQYVATAFSGNGMTYAALAGWIISDLIMGRLNPYKELYDPKRKLEVKAVLYKARDYTAEFFGGAVKNIFR